MADLVKSPRWRPGHGRSIAGGPVLLPQRCRHAHGPGVCLTLLGRNHRYTLRLSDREAGPIARQILTVGGLANEQPVIDTAMEADPRQIALDF